MLRFCGISCASAYIFGAGRRIRRLNSKSFIRLIYSTYPALLQRKLIAQKHVDVGGSESSLLVYALSSFCLKKLMFVFCQEKIQIAM